MPKIDPFEKYSDEYDQWFIKNFDLYQTELEAVRQLIPSGSPEGLEVGIGTGKFAAPLGIKIGVEPSGKMARKARTQGLDVYPGVAEDLPFSDGRFDYVLMVTTICFVYDVMKALREAFRVLKPHGCIIIGFIDKESELGSQCHAKREQSKFYKDATFLSAEEVLTYLEQAGFTTAKVKQTVIPGEPYDTIWDGCSKGGFVVIKAVK